jgi:hypothetical protein
LTKELEHTGVLYIGRAGAHDSFFGRTLHLVNDALPIGGEPARVTQPVVAAAT